MTLQREKVLQAVEIVKEENVDLWITIGRETVMNSDPVVPIISPCEFGSLTAVMITNSGRNICLTGHLDYNGMIQGGAYDEILMYDKSFKEEFFKILKEENPQQIALNYSTDVASDGITHGLYMRMMEFLDEFGYQGEIISAEKIIGKLRGRKSPQEIERMKKAIVITEMILKEAKDFIKAGVTEKEIHAFCQSRIQHYGVGNAWEVLHNPGVMCGPDTVTGHSGPTDLAAKGGDLITLDFGVRVEDYCSDIQRVFYVLKEGETEAPKKYQEALVNIQNAVKTGMAAMSVGVPGYYPDGKARAYLASINYPDFNFGFGHQVGRETHDGGVMMGPQWERYKGIVEGPLEENMVLTVDVNLTFEDGHMGQEDMAHLTKDGAVLLSHRQEEIYLCGTTE
jgi:Xaa-Pro aminopeptidase